MPILSTAKVLVANILGCLGKLHMQDGFNAILVTVLAIIKRVLCKFLLVPVLLLP